MSAYKNKKIILFDLDGTLAESKSSISPEMAQLVGLLLKTYEVCVISGGALPQFEEQLLKHLPTDLSVDSLGRLHILPTSGAQYYEFTGHVLHKRYSYELSAAQKRGIIELTIASAKALSLWPPDPYGKVIEDRGSQITFSGLGQEAPYKVKATWDPDDQKKTALRNAIAAELPEFEVRVGGTTSVDITLKGIDKAFGIREIAKAKQWHLKDMLYIGDKLQRGGNDNVVKRTGIDCLAVRSVTDTIRVIRGLVN